MKFFAEPMSHVFTNDTESTTVSFRDNCLTDFTDGASGGESVQSEIEAVESTLSDASSLLGDLADQESLALISMPAINDGGDVHVDDVTFLQNVTIGNTVANHFIHARAAALGVALIPERGRNVPVVVRPLMNQIINLTGRDTRFDVGSEVVQ